MADLLNLIKGYKDEMQKEDMFVVFWRDGRYANDSWSCGWSAESFMRKEGYLEQLDMDMLEEILDIDSMAIAVPYYHENFLTGKPMKNMEPNELFAEILHLYADGLCTLERFIKRQKNSPIQVARKFEEGEKSQSLEELKDIANRMGMPFSNKFYAGDESEDGADLYVYDGSMSVEDFRLRCQLMELAENVERETDDLGEDVQEPEDKEIKETIALKL